MILAQLGARVIKVEIPSTGDDSRAYGPFANGKSLYFSAINYDKQSIALNLKQAPDREIFEGLVGIADVLVENFRPGTMEKLGYGWETLHARYPQLIYGAASGFGNSGPYSKRAAYDMVVQGMGGIMSMTGQPNAPPTRVGVSIGDLAAGLYLALGLVGALYKRSQGGGAVKVDVAMLDCQVALLTTPWPLTSGWARLPSPRVRATGRSPPSRCTPHTMAIWSSPLATTICSDSWRGRLGRPDLLDNPDYKTNALRRAHVDQLESDMEQTLRVRRTKEWLDILNGAGVPCGPVNSVDEVANDPQVGARHMIGSIADPVIGNLQIAGNLIKMSGVPERADHTPPPAVDGDRAAILALLNQT